MLLVDWEGNGNICKPYVCIYESLDRDAKKKKIQAICTTQSKAIQN